jgi:hypothetical protein
LPPGNNYRIGVYSNDAKGSVIAYDLSDAPFSIVPAKTNVTIQRSVLSPSGTLTRGTSVNIGTFDVRPTGSDTITINRIVLVTENTSSYIKQLDLYDANGAKITSAFPSASDSNTFDTGILSNGWTILGGFNYQLTVRANIIYLPTCAQFKVGITDIGFKTATVVQSLPVYGYDLNLGYCSNSVFIVSPNGGESWEIGKTYNITWTSTNIPSNAQVELIYDNYVAPTVIGTVYNTGSFSWTIPVNIIPANNYDICVRYYLDSTHNTRVEDCSNSMFAIKSVSTPSITVLSPNGGESWKVGETHRISWQSTGVQNVTMYLYDNRISGSGAIVNYPVPNNQHISASQGYYDWTIPSNVLQANDGKNFTIIIQDANNYQLSDQSNAPFSIVAAGAPYISAVSPSSGPAGTQINITGSGFSSLSGLTAGTQYGVWISNGQYSAQMLWSTSNGNLTVNNDSSLTVTIPSNVCPGAETPFCSTNFSTAIVPGSYSIYVRNSNAISNKVNFSVTSQTTTPSITVLSPNGGETWKAGSTYAIDLNVANVDKVTMYLMRTSNLTGGTITYNYPLSLSSQSLRYYYTVPSNMPVASTYKVWAIAYKTGYGSVQDWSDNPFAITMASTGGFGLDYLQSMLASIAQTVAQLNIQIQGLMGR